MHRTGGGAGEGVVEGDLGSVAVGSGHGRRVLQHRVAETQHERLRNCSSRDSIHFKKVKVKHFQEEARQEQA